MKSFLQYISEAFVSPNNGAKYGQAIFLVGGAASGKSTAIRKFIDSASYKTINPDGVKDLMRQAREQMSSPLATLPPTPTPSVTPPPAPPPAPPTAPPPNALAMPSVLPVSYARRSPIIIAPELAKQQKSREAASAATAASPPLQRRKQAPIIVATKKLQPP